MVLRLLNGALSRRDDRRNLTLFNFHPSTRETKSSEINQQQCPTGRISHVSHPAVWPEAPRTTG